MIKTGIVVISAIDKPINGGQLLYPRYVVEDIIAQINAWRKAGRASGVIESLGLMKFLNDGNIPTDNIGFEAFNFRIENDQLLCDIEIMNTSSGKLVQNYYDENVPIIYTLACRVFTSKFYVSTLPVESAHPICVVLRRPFERN